MSRIILHVGTHKTATTTLQDSLAYNRKLLTERGVVFPAIGRSPLQHALVTHWTDDVPECLRDARPARDHWRDLAERFGPTDLTVLISSEEFSRSLPKSVDMRELRSFLTGFGQKTVVCTLRNQLSYIQSIYLEITKKSGGPGFDAFLNQALSTGHASGLFLDFGALYNHLLSGFSEDEIVFVSYEAATGDPDGLLGHLFRRLGLPLRSADLAPLPAGNSNVSPDPLASWVANRVASPKVADRRLLGLVGEVLAEVFGPGARTTLFARPEAAKLAAHFAPLNAAFEERYRRIEPGFALAPLDLGSELIYRGQLGLPFWIRLAQRLHDLAGA
jgi:hypothetical protein